MNLFRLMALLCALSSLCPAPASAARLRLCWENLAPEHAEQITRRGWSDAARLESNLEILWQDCLARRGGDAELCERYGAFGPDSMIWEVAKVTFVALFSEFQLYLELAHPPSIQGVVDWSPGLKKDPVKRFQHTLDVLWRITWRKVIPAMLTVNPLYTMARQRALQEPISIFDSIDDWLYGKMVGGGRQTPENDK